MPKIEVIRKGITPAVRPVPTDTTLAILPTTLDRVGMEVEDEEEQPVQIDSVNDAFDKFKPSIHFEALVGEGATEFVAELEFHSLQDFAPENIQQRVPGQRNDIADLQNRIDLLYRLKDRWSSPAVKRAWNDPSLRRQILAALARLRAEIERLAQATKEGA
jgi:type VI secretion system protein ImpB